MDDIVWLEQLLKSLAMNFPIPLAVFTVIGVLRTINKPLFYLLRAYVKTTPSLDDDAVLDRFEQSKGYRLFTFLLDLVASIPQPKKETPPK